MKILLTGGNGYVGREVARLLMGQHRVCILDSLRSGRLRFSSREMEQIDFIKADIRNEKAIQPAIAAFAPDAILHLAAIHYIPECEDNPALTIDTNVVGTMNLLQACPQGCRFVFASSGAVYKPDGRMHREASAILEPTDIYGLSKLQGEHYVRYMGAKRALSTVVVRLFNVVGPGETNPHLLPEIVAQLKAGRNRIKLGNLWPKRDYIHVKDAARGFASTLFGADIEPGKTVTVNLGTSQPYSVEEIIGKLRLISGCKIDIEQDLSRVRAVDRPFLAADNSLIAALFGWKATHTLDDALSDLWSEPDLSDHLLAAYR